MSRRSRWKVLLGILGVICLLGLFYGGMRWLETRWRDSQEANSQDRGSSQELQRLLWGDITLYETTYRFPNTYESYLFIGTDDSGDEEATGEDYRGNMADFLLLAVVNRTEGTYAFLQLNRDTMTEIKLIGRDGTGSARADIQLCTAHWYGGTPEQSAENTVDAVERLLGGMPIDGYYCLNMNEISELNHAVGGVTVTIEDDFSEVDASLKQGETITLSDEQARSYLQARQGVGDGENTSRMARQKQYLDGFLKKIKEISEDDPEFAVNLYNDLTDRAVTNLTGSLVSDLAVDVLDAENRGTFSFDGTIEVGQHLSDGIDHTEFYLDEASVVEVMKQLYELEEQTKK